MSVLVLQHPALASCQLSPLWHHLNISAPSISGDCVRLPIVDAHALPASIHEQLDAQNIDFAIIPNQNFQNIGLIVTDMDSTLITIECIDEIAAQNNIKDQVSEITERAMRGELDFSQSLIERVALLKGLPAAALEKVYEEKLKLTPGAQTLIQQAQEHHCKIVLVSGGFTFFTEKLQTRLNLTATFANQLEIIDGHLTGRVTGQIIDANAKARILKQYQTQLNLQDNQVLAMGDGANDIPMLQAAGFSVAYHAKPKTKAFANIHVNHLDLSSVAKYFG